MGHFYEGLYIFILRVSSKYIWRSQNLLNLLKLIEILFDTFYTFVIFRYWESLWAFMCYKTILYRLFISLLRNLSLVSYFCLKRLMGVVHSLSAYIQCIWNQTVFQNKNKCNITHSMFDNFLAISKSLPSVEWNIILHIATSSYSFLFFFSIRMNNLESNNYEEIIMEQNPLIFFSHF